MKDKSNQYLVRKRRNKFYVYASKEPDQEVKTRARIEIDLRKTKKRLEKLLGQAETAKVLYDVDKAKRILLEIGEGFPDELKGRILSLKNSLEKFEAEYQEIIKKAGTPKELYKIWKSKKYAKYSKRKEIKLPFIFESVYSGVKLGIRFF